MKTRKKILSCLLAVCLVLGLAGAAFAAEPEGGYVPGNYVQNYSMWIRSAPLTESASLGKLPKNSVVAVPEILNDSWGYVSYNGVTGWVSLLYSDLLDVTLTVARLPDAAAEADFAAMKEAGVSGVLLSLGYAAPENAEAPLVENGNFRALASAAAEAGLAVGGYFTSAAADAAAGDNEGAFVRGLLENAETALTLPVFLNVAEAPAEAALPAVAAAFASVLRNVGFRPGVYCTAAQAEAFPALAGAENGAFWVSDVTAEECPQEAAVLWEYRGATQEEAYTLSRCYYDFPNVLSRPCAKDGHVPGDRWIVVTASTCTEPGKSVRYCTLCREIVEEKEVEPSGHFPVIDAAVAPTCTASGASEGVHCSVCNRVLVKPQILSAAGHSWQAGEETDPATGEAVAVYTCSVCGLTLPAKARLAVGDVNFDNAVTAEDARLVLRAAVGLEDYRTDGIEFIAADANEDGAVTAEDARLVLRAAVDLEALGAVLAQLPDAAVLERLPAGAEDPENPNEEPTSEEPSSEEPSSEEPASEEPSSEEPTSEEPTSEEPTSEEPSSEEPTSEEPASEEPASEEPSSEEPASEEPASEEPSSEEPASEEPASEEPSSEEPSSEEPTSEEPASEEEQTITVKDETGAEVVFALLDTIEYEGNRYYVLAATAEGHILEEELYVVQATTDAETGAVVLSDVEEAVGDAVFALYEQKNADPAPAASETAQAIADFAKKQIGKGFVFGGVGPDTFDNSGFVYYCCKENGVTVPRLTGEIAAAGEEVSREQLLPGDIVIFAGADGEVELAGIYIGEDSFISCNNSDAPTAVLDLNREYWSTHFMYGRRVA